MHVLGIMGQVCSNLIRLFLLLLIAVLLANKISVAEVSDSTEVKTVSEILTDSDEDGEFDYLHNNMTVGGRATVGTSVLHSRYMMVYLQDQSAGVLAFADTLGRPVNKGDSLVVTGELELYYGKPQIAVESLRIIDSEPKIPSAVSLETTYAKPEQYLGMLIKGEAVVSEGITRSDVKSIKVSPSKFSSDSLTVYVSSSHPNYDDFAFDVLSVGDRIYIQGIMDEYTFEDSGKIIYEILPRTPKDIEYAGIPQSYLNILLWGGGILFFVIVGWVVSLRRKVKSKTKVITDALEEKEILMKEIHHRVKNNLSTVAGLLELQIHSTDKPQFQEMLEDSKSRIQSMALIHDKLYQTELFTYIRGDNYLKELVNAIGDTLDLQNDVEVVFEMDEIELHVDKVVTCGLLVNELVVNAFKHAFNEKNQKQGILKILLQNEDNEVVLSVGDNGPGLPDSFEKSNGSSLGFMLISNFANQLEADMQVDSSDEGAVFTFVFPIG